MRKYNLKREKAHYGGMLRGIDFAIDEIDNIITKLNNSGEAYGLYLFRDKMLNERSRIIELINDIKV